jgi:hypothetical protein
LDLYLRVRNRWRSDGDESAAREVITGMRQAAGNPEAFTAKAE